MNSKTVKVVTEKKSNSSNTLNECLDPEEVLSQFFMLIDCNYWGLGVAEYRDWLFEQIESSMKPMICSDAINSLYESCDEMKEDIKMYLSMKIRHDLQIADAEIRHFSNDIYATPNTKRRKKYQEVLMNRLSESAS